MSIGRTFRDLGDEQEEQRMIIAARLGRGEGMGWNEVLKSKRVLLVSEAGVGKTYECQQEAKRRWDNGEAAFYLDLAGLKDNSLRDLLDVEQEGRFDQWLVSQSDVATFFLDSIDELELTLGKFDTALARFAKPLAGHLQRIRVVVTSRPIPIDEEVFRRRLPVPPSAQAAPSPKDFADIAVQRRPKKEIEEGPPEWRNVALLPLTDSQIRDMAAHENVTDIDAFMADIARRDAQDFARRPQDLIELCADWHAKQQVRTHADQVATNIAVKLKPRASSARPEKAELSEAKALEGARRLALASLLARKLTIRHSADADISAQDTTALEPAEILKDWDVKERATLMERPLFGFATYGRVRFHHRSVIEYLAAEELQERLERGMPRASVHRLLFADTAQGERVVRPSMRPVAAWLALRRDDIFEHVRDIDPSVLLDYGDPASLRPHQRIQALRAYAMRYGMGGWRGLKVPYLQIHRFATPELGLEIQNLWAQGIENTEVRQLLLRLIAAAKIESCADLAFPVVSDPVADEVERILALDALLAVEESRLPKICDAVEKDRTLWPNKLAKLGLDRLFPLVMPPDQFCRALQTVSENKRTVGELTYHLPETIAHGSFTVDQLETLRSGLDVLIAPGTSWSETAYSIVAERRDLVRMYTVVCLRLWKSGIAASAALIASTVRALRLLAHDDVGREEYPKELRAALQSTSSDVRSQIFWEDKRFFESFHHHRDSWRIFHEIAFQGQLDLSLERDWDWLRDTVADEQRLKDERQLALETALWLNRMTSPPDQQERLAILRGLCGSEQDLLGEIEKEFREPDPRWIEMEEEREKNKREREAQDAADHQSWVAFWQEVANNPDVVFTDARAGNTVWNLWQAMSREGDESRSTGWNRRFIESHFGKDVADRMRIALMKQWRGDKPSVRSERPVGERNTYLIRWQLGAAAITAESEDPEWAKKLSDDEARLAARYAPIELNGFPAWFDSLIAAHPNAVDAIIGNELSAELAEPLEHQSHSGTLQDISHAAPDTVAMFLPRLLEWFRTKAGLVSPNECAGAAARRLSSVLNIFMKHAGDDVRGEICAKTEAALESQPPHELTAVWLPLLLNLDPAKGMAAFERIIAPLPVEVDGDAVGWFSSLYGRHGGSLVNLTAEGFTPELILRLLRLSYTHVRSADDIQHEGVFSPSKRDDAQTARNNILHALLSLNGEAGWRAKIEMANDPLVGHFRDRLIAMANEGAAEEADGSAFSYAQLAALDKFGEAPPDTRDAMFALMRDRLDDLDDLLLRDVSPRETWAATRVERQLRRAIAHELNNMRNGCYTVDQEGVTADEKETDIRLRSTSSDQQATIELKVGEADWSAAVLRDKLRSQIVEQYMASDDCRAGCMLITVATARTWVNPDSGASLNFEQLLDFLRTEAERLVAEFGGAIRLLVKGLDLRPRLPKPAAAKKKASSIKRAKNSAAAASKAKAGKDG